MFSTETFDEAPDALGYFHAEFRRTNPFGGWGHEITVNRPEANVSNKEKVAWDNNYVIVDTKGHDPGNASHERAVGTEAGIVSRQTATPRPGVMVTS